MIPATPIPGRDLTSPTDSGTSGKTVDLLSAVLSTSTIVTLQEAGGTD